MCICTLITWILYIEDSKFYFSFHFYTLDPSWFPKISMNLTLSCFFDAAWSFRVTLFSSSSSSPTLCTSEVCVALHAALSIYCLPLYGTSSLNHCQVLFHPWLLKTHFRDKSVEQLNSSSSTNLFGPHNLKDLAGLYAICNLLSVIRASVTD